MKRSAPIDPLQSRTENIKRVYIKEQMDRPVVKKEGSEEPPILAGGEKVRGLELAKPMQNEWIGRTARDDLKQKHRDVQDDERDDDRRPATGLGEVRRLSHLTCFELLQDTIAFR